MTSSFEQRTESGLYDYLATLFGAPGESLATVDYNDHFTAQSTAWRVGDVKNWRTTFLIKDPTQISTELEADGDLPASDLPAGNPPAEFEVNLIGEVANEGSELSATGNAWLKNDQQIVDRMSVKDTLVLKCPSMATPAIQTIYNNQICTLEDMYMSVELPVATVGAVITTSLL